MTRPRRGDRARVACTCTILVATAAAAAADPKPDLAIHHEPPPTHLRMRPRRAAAIEPPAPAPKPTLVMPAAPQQAALPVTAGSDLALRDVRQPVSISVNLGYQVEGTQLTGKGSLADPNGKLPDNSFALLRSYGFGEGFLSTRGVIVPSMSTYFALRFQAAPELGVVDPGAPAVEQRAKPPPIATWFERSGTELRTGWVELKDFAPGALRALRVRAGDLFVYGPWVMHLDGALAAFDSKLVRVQAYAGTRAADYTRALEVDRAKIFGASARIDLRGLPRPLPIALAVETMTVEATAAGDPKSRNAQYEADWRPKQDFALIGKVRTLDDKVAHENLEFRGRYKQVSNLVFVLDHRTADDWRWDPSFGRVDDKLLTARPYLDLGPVQPNLVASLRGGTLIAENLDLYSKVAVATDLTPPEQQRSGFNASYVELGGALQARLRRTVALDLSVLSRQNNLTAPAQKIDDSAKPAGCGDLVVPGGFGTCLALPDGATLGEKGFTEIGTALRMSLGARKLSASLEIYGRKTRYAELYATVEKDHTSDIRGGGRFTVEAWVNERVRLSAAYDLSSRFEFAPEITGYKALRLVLTGTY